MKENWTYKKLGEVCEILNGYAFKSDEYKDDGIRVMRITNVQKGAIVDDDPKFFPLERMGEVSKYILREGDVLMSLTGNVGRVGIITSKFLPAALNQRVACLRLRTDDVNKKYLFHILNSDSFEKDCIFNAAGIAQKNMSTKWLEQYAIPVPPIETQSRIVSELDLLQSIIDKQQAQLKELDKLAQAVFYDMFGDPVENEKGWEVKKLCEVCNIGSSRRIFAEEYVEEGIPFYRSKEIIELSKGTPISVELFISEKRYLEIKKNNGIPSVGDLLITAVGTIGEIWIVDTDKPFYYKDGNIVWLSQISTSVSSLFFQISLHKLIEEYKKKMSIGSAYSALTIVNLKKLDVIVPPLSLQQSFAAKIESIEKQKAAISQSIAETQKLFDYTMDKYFG